MLATNNNSIADQTKAGPYKLELLDPDNFSSHKIAKTQHNFHKHPLMQLDRLEQLAHDLLPTKQCRFANPGMTLNSRFSHHDQSPDGRNLKEVFKNIENPESWLALYDVQSDPEYLEFLEEVLLCIRPYIQREQGDYFNASGFIFISAPPAVTPFHIDRENNFWLQIKGRKKISVFDHTDREVVSARDVENFIVDRTLRGVKLDEQFVDRAQTFDMGPGDGLYFPSTSPHMTTTTDEWVQPGDGVAISIGVVFYTDLTLQQARAYQYNQVARRFKLQPKAPSSRLSANKLKGLAGHSIMLLKKYLRSYEVPKGFYKP